MLKRIGILLSSFILATAVFSGIVSASTAVPSGDTSLYLPFVTAPPQPPQIITFTANVPIADPGETITLSWETSHATIVTLYHLLGGQFSSFWDVASAGQMTYTISSSSRNQEDFALYASSDGQPLASASTAVQRTSYFKYNHTYLKALDGDVWQLFPERSDWQKFTPDALVESE